MKKQTMTYPQCEKCDGILKDFCRGIILQGNIYTSDIDHDGRCVGKLLTEECLPESDMFTKDKVKQIAYCTDCLKDLLGLNDN